MTLGVWMVPLVLVAGVVFLWASAWFEGHVIRLGFDPESQILKAVDTALVDTAIEQAPVGKDDQLATELGYSTA